MARCLGRNTTWCAPPMPILDAASRMCSAAERRSCARSSAMFLLSKMVRETGFKVVLTAGRRDRVFAGYDMFKRAIPPLLGAPAGVKLRPRLLRRLYADIDGVAEFDDSILLRFGRRPARPCISVDSHAVRWRSHRRTFTLLCRGYFAAIQRRSVSTVTSVTPSHLRRLRRDSWQAQCPGMRTFLSQYLLSSQGNRMGVTHTFRRGTFSFSRCALVELCDALPPA